jgi:GNAT superfamily N-acetyltransferase
VDNGAVSTDAEWVVVRRATAADAGPAAEVWLRSTAAALPDVRRAHTDDEVRAWFREHVVPELETWVAVTDGPVVGLLVLAEHELEQLHLAPSWRGRGLGNRLVTWAKRRRPAGIELWTFQVDAGACRFYERHGFVETARTDGARNEEHEPDIRYTWRRTTGGGPSTE